VLQSAITAVVRDALRSTSPDVGLTLLEGRWDQLRGRIINKLGTQSAYLPLILRSDDPSEIAQHEHEVALFDKVCELLRWPRCMLSARARDVSAT
jgi:hypothetical protein